MVIAICMFNDDGVYSSMEFPLNPILMRTNAVECVHRYSLTLFKVGLLTFSYTGKLQVNFYAFRESRESKFDVKFPRVR